MTEKTKFANQYYLKWFLSREYLGLKAARFSSSDVSQDNNASPDSFHLSSREKLPAQKEDKKDVGEGVG